jgi:outer membrane receptor for ferrienterochelin and colicin
MEDQPASILNVILGWDYKGFSSRLSYRYQAKTVESLDAKYSIYDSYYSTFSLWDLMLNQKITKNISCYANLTNIGNHIDEYYFGEQPFNTVIQPGNSLYDIRSQLGNALPTNSQFYGFRVQVGVKFAL